MATEATGTSAKQLERLGVSWNSARPFAYVYLNSRLFRLYSKKDNYKMTNATGKQTCVLPLFCPERIKGAWPKIKINS